MDVWFTTHLGDAWLLSAVRCTFFCHHSHFQLTRHVARSHGDRFLSSCTRWKDWSGCGFFFLSCICWLCLLMLYDPHTMDVWFTTHLGDARLLSAIRCTFLLRYGRFQLTRRIAWSLGDSWASFHLLIQEWLVWMWFLHVVVRLLRDVYSCFVRHDRVLTVEGLLGEHGQCVYVSKHPMSLFYQQHI